MKLSDQCCTRQQAERLKELGIDGDSLFAYNPLPSNGPPYFGMEEPVMISEFARETKRKNLCEMKWIPAWTGMELGEMLPNGYDTMRVTGHTPHLYSWQGYDLDGKNCPSEKGYRTEAEARGAMLIRLLETNAITSNQVNERLKQ